MIGADLEPYLLVALGNYRIIQASGENAIPVEMSDHCFRAPGIAEHQWYDRVLPGKCLEAKPGQVGRGRRVRVVINQVQFLDRRGDIRIRRQAGGQILVKCSRHS